jgi:hypothetical protein
MFCCAIDLLRSEHAARVGFAAQRHCERPDSARRLTV